MVISFEHTLDIIVLPVIGAPLTIGGVNQGHDRVVGAMGVLIGVLMWMKTEMKTKSGINDSFRDFADNGRKRNWAVGRNFGSIFPWFEQWDNPGVFPRLRENTPVE